MAIRILLVATLTVTVTLTAWAVAAAHRRAQPPVFPHAGARHTVTLTGPNAEGRRLDAIRRARVRLAETLRPQNVAAVAAPRTLECRFVARPAEGTSAKFDCTLANGNTIKVKYGRNPEIHAETAAAALLTRLGYPADTMTIVGHLRCYGCPRFPFATMKILNFLGLAARITPSGYEHGYTDFESVSVEYRFPAPALETDAHAGWAWFELDEAGTRADLDALRLLAAFLAHWDNKSSNQRLVCLDASPTDGTEECREPLLMIQDLGSTFGPAKANVGSWRQWPLWSNRDECLVSMRHLPFHGGTFPDSRISEAGREQLLQQLDALTRADVRQLFLDARFPAFQPNTDAERVLDAWTSAFMDRVAQIRAARCS